MAAKAKGGLNKHSSYIPGPPKKSRQGDGKGTKYAHQPSITSFTGFARDQW